MFGYESCFVCEESALLECEELFWTSMEGNAFEVPFFWQVTFEIAF